MSKPPHQGRQHREVTVMFEPHRLQYDLLQAAYAFLVPLSRRRLTAQSPSPVPPVSSRRQAQKGARHD